MLKEISNEIRSAFQSNRNGVIQLLVVNIAVFLVIGWFANGSEFSRRESGVVLRSCTVFISSLDTPHVRLSAPEPYAPSVQHDRPVYLW